VRLLLDTHTLLWFVEGSPRLSRHARAAIDGLAILSADATLDAYGPVRTW